MMKVLLIDSNVLAREGLVSLLRGIVPSVSIFEAGGPAEAVSCSEQWRPHLTVLALNGPSALGAGLVRTLRDRHPQMRIVVTSDRDGSDEALTCIEQGACAYLPTRADIARIRQSLEGLVAGRAMESVLSHGANGSASGLATRSSPVANLTDRQLEVLALLVAGLSNKAIARRLDIAESTVKLHVSGILREFRVPTRTQAIIEVARRGLRLPAVQR